MDIQTLFDSAAEIYDQTRRQYIPCFNELYHTAIDIIPNDQKSDISILDLGAGTGLLSALVMEVFPQAHFTLVDISENMLDQAKQRFSSKNRNITYEIINFIEDPIPGKYDLIVSALALHHTPQVKLKPVFQKIYNALPDEGSFINIDQALGATPEIESKYQNVWERQARMKGCSEEEIDIANRRMKADKTAPLRSQLQWLEEAGFSSIDCWYKNYRFVVYSGCKLNT
jgi:tRNA (cmo5U34)-methyltransferase